jgi:hypothetical protein
MRLKKINCKILTHLHFFSTPEYISVVHVQVYDKVLWWWKKLSQAFLTVAQHTIFWPVFNKWLHWMYQWVSLVYQIENYTFVGLAGHLQVYTYKVTNILQLCWICSVKCTSQMKVNFIKPSMHGFVFLLWTLTTLQFSTHYKGHDGFDDMYWVYGVLSHLCVNSGWRTL